MKLQLVPGNCSRSRGVVPSLAELGKQSAQLTSVWVLPVWSVVRRIVCCAALSVSTPVSVGNVFRSGSSSERHHDKRTAAHAPQQRLPFREAKVTRPPL
jgi:hypothetical protein